MYTHVHTRPYSHPFAYLSTHLESENWTNCAPTTTRCQRRHSRFDIPNPSIVSLPVSFNPLTPPPRLQTLHTIVVTLDNVSPFQWTLRVSSRQRCWQLFSFRRRISLSSKHAINPGLPQCTNTHHVHFSKDTHLNTHFETQTHSHTWLDWRAIRVNNVIEEHEERERDRSVARRRPGGDTNQPGHCVPKVKRNYIRYARFIVVSLACSRYHTENHHLGPSSPFSKHPQPF